MEDDELLPVIAIKDAARWFDDLAITGSPKFLRTAPALRKIGQLLDTFENALDEL